MKNCWLKMENCWEKIPNWGKVILSACLSFVLIYHLLLKVSSYSEIIKQGGFWTLLTLIVSSPVAFMIWSFRDRNATDQINNSRKDTNLKEYHKIVEWITNKDSSDELKISAIYYLKNFYEDKSLGFQENALYLLLSTWESMQREILNDLNDNLHENKGENIQDALLRLTYNGNSPLGIAITRVLLSNEGKYLLSYPEVFSNFCFAGMNFSLSGLSDNIVTNIFSCENIKFSGADFRACKFKKSNLNYVDFSNSNFLGTIWGGIDRNDVKPSEDVKSSEDVKFLLKKILSSHEKLENIHFFRNVNFSNCDLRYSIFCDVSFEECEFSNVNLENSLFLKYYLVGGGSFIDVLKKSDAKLTGKELNEKSNFIDCRI